MIYTDERKKVVESLNSPATLFKLNTLEDIYWIFGSRELLPTYRIQASLTETRLLLLALLLQLNVTAVFDYRYIEEPEHEIGKSPYALLLPS